MTHSQSPTFSYIDPSGQVVHVAVVCAEGKTALIAQPDESTIATDLDGTPAHNSQ